MTIGTRSILFGVHQFILHPLLVAFAWWRLYGFEPVYDAATDMEVSLKDPRLWATFFLHDVGYWGLPEMDGAEGDSHPFRGAEIVSKLFDRPLKRDFFAYWWDAKADEPVKEPVIVVLPDMSTYRHVSAWLGPWGQFSLFHSRFLSRYFRTQHSRLCIADKYTAVIEPAWLYLPRAWATGELWEYMGRHGATHEKVSAETAAKYQNEHGHEKAATPGEWYANFQRYIATWVEKHRDGGPDVMTVDLYEEEHEPAAVGP